MRLIAEKYGNNIMIRYQTEFGTLAAELKAGMYKFPVMFLVSSGSTDMVVKSSLPSSKRPKSC